VTTVFFNPTPSAFFSGRLAFLSLAPKLSLHPTFEVLCHSSSTGTAVQ